MRLSFFTTVGALEGLVVSLDRTVVALEVLFEKRKVKTGTKKEVLYS